MYSLFLGPWNQYTCCFFDGTDDLEAAEVAKLEMLCDKLELGPGDRLLDIGSGWGGFAKYAASTRGCQVIGGGWRLLPHQGGGRGLPSRGRPLRCSGKL